MRKNRTILFFVIAVMLAPSAMFPQVFSCNVEKDVFRGKVNEAVVMNIGEEQYVQIQTTNGDKLLYLYIKKSKLNEEIPITLEYKEHNFDTGQTPDAEAIWAPDGADAPQWHSIEGEAVVSSYNKENDAITGTFEFVVEKASYSSRADRKKQTAKITNGVFENIQFKQAAE